MFSCVNIYEAMILKFKVRVEGQTCKLYSRVHKNLGSKCRQRSANVCKISACGVVDIDRLVACSHKSGQFSVKNPHLVKISFLPAAR